MQKKNCTRFIALFAAVIAAVPAFAGTNTFTGAVAKDANNNLYWSNPLNWSNGAPQNGDDLIFPDGFYSFANSVNDTHIAVHSLSTTSFSPRHFVGNLTLGDGTTNSGNISTDVSNTCDMNIFLNGSGTQTFTTLHSLSWEFFNPISGGSPNLTWSFVGPTDTQGFGSSQVEFFATNTFQAQIVVGNNMTLGVSIGTAFHDENNRNVAVNGTLGNAANSVTVLAGGTLSLSNNYTAPQHIILSSGTLVGGHITGAITLQNDSHIGSCVVDGVITSAGGPHVLTLGSVTLTNGNNNYGSTVVSGSFANLTLSNTSGSATGTGDVSIQSNATISGTGFITGNTDLAAGATLSPGTVVIGASPVAIGTLHLGNTTWHAGAKFVFEFSANSSTNDFLTLTGNLTKADVGQFLFNIIRANNQILVGSYDLIHFNATNFLPSDFSYSVRDAFNAPTGGNGSAHFAFDPTGHDLLFVVDQTFTIPEPASLTLLLPATLLLPRKRHSKAKF